MLPGITYDVVLELAAKHGVPHAVRDIAEAELSAAPTSVDDFLDQGSAADHDAGWRARRQRRQRRQAGPWRSRCTAGTSSSGTRSCAVADESAKQQETLLEFPAISRSRSWAGQQRPGTGRADRCCQARSRFRRCDDGNACASSGGKYVA